MTSRNLGVMYYHAQAARQGEAPGGLGALEMTPSVALRSLFEQLVEWETMKADGHPAEIDEIFVGPLLPPHEHLRRPIGDPAHEAVAEYASYVIARAGQLTTQSEGDEEFRLRQHRLIGAHLRAAEHALAIDLARIIPEVPLRARQSHARAALALAAFWCDRRELTPSIGPAANDLLGKRPADLTGSILWEHAVLALTRSSGSSGKSPETPRVDIDLTVLERQDSPAA